MDFNSEDFNEIQKERQEYVKNIGVEYRYGCYEENRADSCHVLAEYMEAIEQSFSKAFTLFKENCDLRKHPQSCYKYGNYLLAGRECEVKSLKEAIIPFQVACDGNIAKGCRYLSLIYWNGEPDREPDSIKAEQYMKKACDLEDSEACWLLSTWYLGNKEQFVYTKGQNMKKIDQTRKGELERNMEKALQYGKMACDLVVPHSCANVGRMYALGDGIPKDPDLAKEYIDRAKAMIAIMKKTTNVGTGFTG